MHALPEVEVIRRDLDKEIVSRRIRSAEIRPGSNAMKVVKRHGRRKEVQDLLVGAKIDSVDRKGTRIFFELDNEHVLVIDLGSSGQLFKNSASDDYVAHTHIVLEFTIGGQLRLVDPGYTAAIFVVDRQEYDNADDLKPRGIDPLDNEQPPTWHQLSSMLEGRSIPMRELMRDQNLICGLGDVYADEILFSAGIRPDRISDTLSSQDVRRLYRALFETLQDVVKARGTSRGENGFTDLQGNAGTYQEELKVYERQGQSCPRCRSEIVQEPVDGGFTYFCPQCQS